MPNIFLDADIYRVTSPYGNRTRNGRTEFHKGEDWGTGEGTGLFSIRPGGVVNNWSDSLGGNIISITYNDLVGLYDPSAVGVRFQFHHCKNFLQPTGYRPAAGEVFGLTGQTGNAEGPHVHIEVYEAAHVSSKGVIDRVGKVVDPKKYSTNTNLVNKGLPPTSDRLPQFLAELRQLIAKYEK